MNALKFYFEQVSHREKIFFEEFLVKKIKK